MTPVRLRWATVSRIVASRPGLIELECDDGDGSRAIPCVAYPDLVGGAPEVGQRLLLNTAALDAGLGTGGFALVVALAESTAAPPTSQGLDPGADLSGDDDEWTGSLVKARYTPLQVLVSGVDEQSSPHHDLLRDADSIDGMVVVVADLHSALPAIVAGVGADGPLPRIAYIMTDGAALPIALSHTVAALKEANLLTCTITAGQAYGGDLEAATPHSALLAARHVAKAEIAIVIQGPGSLGTGTRWGFSGVGVGEAVNAAVVLSGRPVGVLRISLADPRTRHHGLSHHNVIAYGRVAAHPADLVVPIPCGTSVSGSTFLEQVLADAEPLFQPVGIHRRVDVGTAGLRKALMASPATMSTMGRTVDADPLPFLASAAAGRHAGSLVRRDRW